MFCTWSDTSVYFVMLYESEEIASPEFWHSIVFSCVKTVKFVQLQKQIQNVSLGALPTVPGCSWICLQFRGLPKAEKELAEAEEAQKKAAEAARRAGEEWKTEELQKVEDGRRKG